MPPQTTLQFCNTRPQIIQMCFNFSQRQQGSMMSSVISDHSRLKLRPHHGIQMWILLTTVSCYCYKPVVPPIDLASLYVLNTEVWTNVRMCFGQEVTQPVRWPLFCHRQANADCLNSFGNWTSPSDNSNNLWKRLRLVSWAAVPHV